MNRVRTANITNNLGHFNGRCGFGALMGSKNVRAVAALGTERLEYADPHFLRETAQHYAKTFKDNPLGEALFVYGTTAFPEILSSGGALPVDNGKMLVPQERPGVGKTGNNLGPATAPPAAGAGAGESVPTIP